MVNEEIRKDAAAKRVFLWEIAKKFGVTDSYFSKMLREEFSEEMKNKALKFINEIAAERNGG